MSVVNKMLQDLEARKSQPGDVNADYQPPQKQQPKWLVWVLLVVAVVAIAFALLDFKNIFASPESPVVTSQNMPKKAMSIAEQKSQQVSAQTELISSDAQPIVSEVDTAPVKTVNETTQNSVPVVEEKQPLVVTSTEIAPPKTTQESIQPVVIKQATAAPQKNPSFTMSGSTKANQSTSLKQRIAESLNSNDLEKAQSLLSQLLSDEPDNLKARKKLASLYFSQGNYAQTKQLLIRGIDLDPLHTDLRLMLARLYAVQDDTEQALKVMKDIKPNVNSQTEFLAYRAALAQQLKQPQISKADYLSLAGIDATNAKWWLGLAIAQDQLGEINNAIKAYEKAYSLGQLDDSVDEFIQQRISVLVGTQ